MALRDFIAHLETLLADYEDSGYISAEITHLLRETLAESYRQLALEFDT